MLTMSPSRIVALLHGSARGLLAMLVLLAVAACSNGKLEMTPAAPAGPTYSGPAYLRGTVGSMGRLRNAQALPVAGFGVVVGLNGTGHRGAPAFIRQHLLSEMRKQGVGSVKMRDILPLTPAQMLDSTDTAVVLVEGLIPRGATAGTRFDLLVTALPGTETTSLSGGTLYTTALAIGGADPANRYSHPLAKGRGPIYTNPFGPGAQVEDLEGFRREAIVVGGGEVTKDRSIEIVLNQPSWQRARAVEDRINERFPMAADDRAQKTANAVSNLVIEIRVPRRYAVEPDELLSLISNFYISNAPGFEVMQARRLMTELRDDPSKVDDVVLAWRALGKVVIPVLREAYRDPDLTLRLAALDAGAHLQDERASGPLYELAEHPDALIRAGVARSLVALPRSLRGGRALRKLLDDDDLTVRVTAYDSLARIGDPVVERFAVRDEAGIKFVIDRVPSERPLVYITYFGIPRVVIFDQDLGFDLAGVARLWNNRLMLRETSTLAEALFGLKDGRSVFLPAFGRGPVQEIGSPRWSSSLVDAAGHSAPVIIASEQLRARFEQMVGAPGDQAQALIVAQYSKRPAAEKGLPDAGPGYELRLLDVRPADATRPVTVYYLPRGRSTGTTHKIAPNVAALTFLLAARPSIENQHAGLDLTYSEVVDALYHLCRAGSIPAPIEVDTTPMAALINRRETPPAGPGVRPETGTTGTNDETAGPVPGVPGRPETALPGGLEGANDGVGRAG